MPEHRVKPTVNRIERCDESEQLYTLENQRNEILHDCAKEWLRVMGYLTGRPDDYTKREHWRVAIPQALFDLLESYETASATIAAQAYLESKGYTVKLPD